MTRFAAALVTAAAIMFGGASVAQPKGDLSTIVMDGANGTSAVGMTIELYALGEGAPRKVAQAMTDDEGRAELIASGPIPVGTYELRFKAADYFRKHGVAVGDPATLDIVLVRFSVTEPTGHYHVPLVCSPNGYVAYRGT
jgi:hydroxyisourate hydrolase